MLHLWRKYSFVPALLFALVLLCPPALLHLLHTGEEEVHAGHCPGHHQAPHLHEWHTPCELLQANAPVFLNSPVAPQPGIRVAILPCLVVSNSYCGPVPAACQVPALRGPPALA